jgi:hypothetical protein
MCLEWGLTIGEYDRLSHVEKLEMRAFWNWRVERNNARMKTQSLNTKFFANKRR